MDDKSEQACSPNTDTSRKRYVTAMHLAVLTGLCLLLTWPVMIHGIPDLAHDGYHHARWAKEFSTQFWKGDLFPRWFADVNGGYGGPSGFFSPPLPNYVSSVFWPFLSTRDPNGWRAAGYPIIAAIVLSAVAAYFWLLSFGSAGAALLGAMVYTIAPYHVAVDLYMRGAASELWVFVCFPLVLLSAQKLIQQSKWAAPSAAVCYALAVLAHPTTSLCFAPIPICFVFCFSEKQQRIRNAAILTIALLVGVGLSAVYILPATLDHGKAHTEWYRIGHCDYHNEWLIQNEKELSDMIRVVFGADPSSLSETVYFPFRMRVVGVTISALLAILALFLVVRRCGAGDRSRSLALFWLVTAFVSFFLMNRVSSVVWSLVVFMKYLQFPFRLNIMLLLCLVALIPLAYPYLTKRPARLLTGFFLLMLVPWLAADLYSSRFNFSGIGVGDRGKQSMFQAPIRRLIDPPEMWPIPGNVPALSNITTLDWLIATHPPKTVQLDVIGRRVSGTASVQSWEPRRVVLKVDALRRTVLQANHFYYSGWRARVEGTNAQLSAYSSRDGFLLVDIPPGRYNVVVELPRDNAERAGIVISLLSLLLVGGSALWAYGHSPSAARRRETAEGVARARPAHA